jgi:hypothetical protein
VAAPRDRDGVVLDRAESREELAHGVDAAGKRPSRRERLARDEEAPRSLGRDPHARGASCMSHFLQPAIRFRSLLGRQFGRVAQADVLQLMLSREALFDGEISTFNQAGPCIDHGRRV